MQYRREIDGLRALAIVPVVLYHAGLQSFKGGFVGVDVFFVISGYLITSIILEGLDKGQFSIAEFYERRARRILPALFLVMATSLVLGYLTLMPDEFKNLGQSLVATTLFSNNVLLALTANYWDLAGEFKPLLHTWSLGVEEQYYALFPLFLLFAYRRGMDRVSGVVTAMAIGSFIACLLLMKVSPMFVFYILPTRAWEILIGALASFALRRNRFLSTTSVRVSDCLSGAGLLLIAVSVFVLDAQHSSGWHLLIPTTGATLVIMCSREGTHSNSLLGSTVFVYLGLMSYSIYLWHQPVFAFLRIYSIEKPGLAMMGFGLLIVLVLSYLSWRYVERPFRNHLSIKRVPMLIYLVTASVLFVVSGLYLNKSYGIPGRVFGPEVSPADMDKRLYNERAFSYKKDAFSDDGRRKLLIIGNSFGRDFLNITLETFSTSDVEMIYRDDLHEGIHPYKNKLSEQLFSRADIIVFSYGGVKTAFLKADLKYAASGGKRIYYVGTKDFGYNLNWLMRLAPMERANQFNRIAKKYIEDDEQMNQVVPEGHYVSLLSPVLVGGKIPITDASGYMLSTDRKHLTKYGAIFFGENAVRRSGFGAVLARR